MPFARALYLCAYLEVGPQSKPMLVDSSLFFHNLWGKVFALFKKKISHKGIKKSFKKNI